MIQKKSLAFAKKPFLILFVVILSVFAVYAGVLYYRHEAQTIRQEKQNDLQAIAQLKVNQVVQWQQERLADAAVISKRPFFIQQLQEWLADKDNAQLQNTIKNDLRVPQEAYNYDAVLLTSLKGELLLSVGYELDRLSAVTMEKIVKVVNNQAPVKPDFYYCELEHDIHYDVILPLKNDKDRTIAGLVLRMDPDDYLYPLIQSWPTPSKTSETLIIRKDGDSVLFLNELRHRKNTAMNLRIPLSETNVPAVQAVLGYQGIWDGKDYRGVDVLADVRPVPDTQWFMIAKIDKKEILSEIYSELIYVIVFTGLVILLIIAGALFFFSDRQKAVYKKLWQYQEEFKTTLYSIGDAVITTDKRGLVQHMNPVAENLTGWRESNARGNKLSKIFRIVNEDTGQPVKSPVERVLREGSIVGLANHTLLISKEGKEIPIADSGAPIQTDSGDIAGVVLVFRDQSEERAAQQAIRQSEQRYRDLFNKTPIGIFRTTSDGRVLNVNPAMAHIVGCETPEEALENFQELSKKLYVHPERRQQFIEQLNQRGHVENFEYEAKKRDGSRVWLSMSARMSEKQPDGTFIIDGFTSDITDRKKAEHELWALKDELERKVAEKTKELQQRVSELQRFHDATVNRELRMKELRDEIERLKGNK